ncbi:beta/gamma crystallin domain-containing protein 2-like isoform X4 [Mytilus californianus]|uniref:beta/gamma crystallin domain-containing protein 2-like isoform X4 n=1 Tax=Mytilus californianus TaxID=6549 RepID=UPI00224671F6|nr:beta/gamma crystallin domain-containing protein 2-like isoform X4 [Mytilus californianus]
MTMEPKITLYKEPNFAGDFKVLSEGCEKLVDVGFPDGASSVKVESGVWILYKNEDYKGDICVVIDKGQETKCSISSLKPLENAEVDLSVHPKCTIYQHHFTGRSSTHTQDASNLGNLNNDASSIRVQSGAWVAYEDGNFGGKQTLFLRGYHKHDTFAKWYPGYGKFPNDRFSSIKALPIKIKIKKQPKISLYKDPNHTDTLKTFTTASDNLDKSVLIESGVWILYDHVNYEGDINVVMEGDKLTDFKYSSIKPLKYDFTEDPKCTIFEHDLDVGEDHTLTEEVQNLEKKHMTDVSSIRVHSGAWVGYEHVEYAGKQTLFLRGEHRHSDFEIMSPGYGKFENDKFSSLRALQTKPSFPVKVDFKFDLEKTTRNEATIFSDSGRADEYTFCWEEKAMVSKELTYKTSVPVVVSNSTLKLSAESYYNIGKSDRKKSKKISADLLGKSSNTKSEIEVPFEAMFHQGLNTTWTEKGIFKSTQFYKI